MTKWKKYRVWWAGGDNEVIYGFGLKDALKSRKYVTPIHCTQELDFVWEKAPDRKSTFEECTTLRPSMFLQNRFTK